MLERRSKQVMNKQKKNYDTSLQNPIIKISKFSVK